MRSDVRARDLKRIRLYVCDDCLLKLFKAVPLLSWAMRETMLQEAVADLDSPPPPPRRGAFNVDI